MRIKLFMTGGMTDEVYFGVRREFQVGSPLVLEVANDVNVTGQLFEPKKTVQYVERNQFEEVKA